MEIMLSTPSVSRNSVSRVSVFNHDNGDKDLAGYHRFLQVTGSVCKQEGNMVRFKDWGQGKNCTLFAFDNVAGGCVDTPYLNPRQTGELQIEILLGANIN